jgi:serine/threonine protein kinase
MLKDPDDLDSLKIIDLGFATECDVDHYHYPKCGTPGYVAPEVINLTDMKHKYSNKCDLFSCGVILYKLYCIE